MPNDLNKQAPGTLQAAKLATNARTGRTGTDPVNEKAAVLATDLKDENSETQEQPASINTQAFLQYQEFRDEQFTILQRTASTQARVSALSSTSHKEHTKIENQMKALSLLVQEQPEATSMKVSTKITDLLAKQNASAAEKVLAILKSKLILVGCYLLRMQGKKTSRIWVEKLVKKKAGILYASFI